MRVKNISTRRGYAAYPVLQGGKGAVQPPVRPGGMKPERIGRISILVVEDNAAARAMIRQALQSEGYSVIEAADGESALRAAAERAPTLVLLDCALPDMDGFEVGRRMHALDPGVPVIAIVGWARVEEARMQTAWFLDLLVKPLEPLTLVETVERHAGRVSLRSAHSGQTVLVVDEDLTRRKLCELALLSAGFAVVVADDGQAALKHALARTPDVIVANVLMPAMDGFSFCKAVHEEPSTARVPIVLISAHYLESDDRELALGFGASRYVSRMDGLESVVNAVSEAMHAPAAGLAAPPEDSRRTGYLGRIAQQLDRQASIGLGLARRVALQASAHLVLDTLADSLALQLDPESTLEDTLATCLDAASLSVGAILLRGQGGELVLKARVGPSIDFNWEKHSKLLLGVTNSGGIMIPSVEAGPPGVELLVALGATSAVVVPILSRDNYLGLLLLESNRTSLTGTKGEFAVRAARSVALQLGQALSLSRTFSKLSSAEQRYRALLENAHDSIAISTTKGVLLEVNHRMTELLGVPAEQAVGRQVADFAAQGWVESNTAAFEAVVAKGTGSVPPMPLERPDGSQVLVEFSSTVVTVAGEEYVLSIGRDVSERIRLEEQLRQAQKLEAVGRLAGGVAHDFNNLLSVILSYSQGLIAELEPGEPMRQDIHEICTAAERAVDLTRQLQLFSRQQVCEPKVVDLNETLTNTDTRIRHMLGTDVDFVMLPSPELGSVLVDPCGLDQIIMNLVVNARDAMPVGGKLTFETRNVLLDKAFSAKHHGTKPGPHVLLTVTDTGVGMDKTTLARLFEPFFSTKPQDKGTGLGLSIVFGIVQHSGGTVCVYSEPNKGTTFEVYLPLIDSDPNPGSSPVALTALPGSETILLVEGDEQVRIVASGILRKNGYQVIEAADAKQAMLHSATHAGIIHLLISDVVLAEVSGPELAKLLVKSRPAMKVLCMSSYTDYVAGDDIGDADIPSLQKPIALDSLTTKVRQVLDAANDTPPRSTMRPAARLS